MYTKQESEDVLGVEHVFTVRLPHVDPWITLYHVTHIDRSPWYFAIRHNLTRWQDWSVFFMNYVLTVWNRKGVR